MPCGVAARTASGVNWRVSSARYLHARLIGDRVAEESAPYGAGDVPKPVPSPRQKLVVFTEHRDTLNYLEHRITTLLGRKEAVVSHPRRHGT